MLTWERLVELEPRLLGLYSRALDIKRRHPRLNPLDVWIPKNHDGMKEELKQLVGWRRKHDNSELGNDEAYDIAYDKIYFEALGG